MNGLGRCGPACSSRRSRRASSRVKPPCMMRWNISIIFFSFGCRATCSSSDFERMPCSMHFFRSESGILRSDNVSVTEDRARPIFIAKKIGRARSSVTETLSLRNIPDSLRKKCMEHGILSKSLLLQVARQPNEKKMIEMFHRIMQGGLTRDEARRERREEQAGPQRPRPFIFNFEPQDETFKFRIQFKKSHVSRDELISTLREILAQLEGTSAEAADSTAA